MTLEQLLKTPSSWMRVPGPHNQIVISSRVRLARNLQGHPFPGWAKRAERQVALDIIRPAVVGLDEMAGAVAAGTAELSALDRQLLVEKHLISREQAAKGTGSALVINPEQSVSVMINEEDHIRMQALQAGLQLEAVYRLIEAVDQELERQLDFAFDLRLGYLTACPSNVGTGMRASAMVHLPALVLAEQIDQIVQAVGKIGLAVRGLYGEGTEALGNLFQVSNQTTLGEKEEDIIARLTRVIEQIIGHEENARKTLLQKKPVAVFDHIGRAYGILGNAHAISSKEALNLLSYLKLGIDLGFLPESGRQLADDLLTETQPAHLLKGFDRKLAPEERDAVRAEIIRGRLKSLPSPDIDKRTGPTAPDESSDE